MHKFKSVIVVIVFFTASCSNSADIIEKCADVRSDITDKKYEALSLKRKLDIKYYENFFKECEMELEKFPNTFKKKYK